MIGPLNIDRPEWQMEGRCRTYPPELWFPGRANQAAQAKAICHTCPVRTECATFALERPCLVGVWGGMSDKERERARRRMPDLTIIRMPVVIDGPIHGTGGGIKRHQRNNEPLCEACREYRRHKQQESRDRKMAAASKETAA